MLLAGMLAAAACNAQGAKVNGVTIPQSRIDLIAKSLAAQGQADTPELRNRVRDMLVEREIVAQEAIKKGLDKNPELTVQLELQRQQMLGQAYFQEYFKANPITEEALRKEYEAAKAQMPSKEFKAHHILVRQEEEAKQIIAQLKKGANFERLAAEKSLDPGSRTNGGDLGWGNRYVPPFIAALDKLKKGQLTDTPVQTQFGWHVIRLDDARPAAVPTFDEVKNNIQQQMQNQAVQRVIIDLRAKAKIE